MLKNTFCAILAMLALPLLAADLKVEAIPGGLRLSNARLSAVVSAQGGRLVSLQARKTGFDYGSGFDARLLAEGKLNRHSGLCKSRIFESPGDTSLCTAPFELKVTRQTDAEITVEATFEPLNGLCKGMNVRHIYTLKADEARLRFTQRFQAGPAKAAFSPWVHCAVQSPVTMDDKQTVRLYARSRRGRMSARVLPSANVHNMLQDPQEPWFGAAGKGGYGLCLVAAPKAAARFYSWLGAEHLFTMEVIFPKTALSDDGVASFTTWLLPTSRIDNYALASEDYAAGLADGALRLQPAAPVAELEVKCTVGGKTYARRFGNLPAGAAADLPLPKWQGFQDAAVTVIANGRTRTHSARLNWDRDASEAAAEATFKTSKSKASSDKASMYHATPVLYLADNLTVADYFGLATHFPGKPEPVELVLELPTSVTLHGPSPALASATDFQQDGKPFRRYVWKLKRNGYYAAVSMFLSTTLPPGAKAQGRFYAKYRGGEQTPQPLPIESVAFRPVKRLPKRLIAGLGFYGINVIQRWPDIETHLKACGMNTLSLSGFDTSPEAIRATVARANRAGLFITGNTSPTHKVPGIQQEQDAWVAAIDGKREPMLCPSYRGPAFEAEKARIALHSQCGAPIAYWDTENWNKREYCFCPRCLKLFDEFVAKHHPDLDKLSPRQFELAPARHPRHHQAWVEFRLGLGTQLFRAFAEECRKGYAAAPVKGLMPKGLSTLIGLYGVHRRTVYHQFMRYEELAAVRAVDVIMPSYYVSGDAWRVGAALAKLRAEHGSSRIIPWICGGAGPEYEAEGIQQKYILLEIFLHGCMGFTTWPWMGWDALDLKYVAEVMNLVTPIEDIIVDGIPDKTATTDQRHIRVAALARGGEKAILLSDYFHEHLVACTLAFDSPEDAALFDLATGQKLADVKPGRNAVRLGPWGENVRLLYLGKSAPRTDFILGAPAFKKAAAPAAAAFPGLPNDKVAVSTQPKPRRILVENGYYRVGIEQKTGHISLLEWKHSRKKIDFFWLNLDACSLSGQGFSTRMNKAPAKSVKVTEQTPRRVVVSVATDGGAPGANLPATLVYTFTAGSPMIHVRIHVDNPGKKTIGYRRLNQFSFTKAAWTRLLLSAPESTIDLKNGKGTRKVATGKDKFGWAALTDGTSTFALVSLGVQPKPLVHVYDADKQYCAGVAGRASHDGPLDLEQFIYLGPGAAKELNVWAEYCRKTQQ